MGKYKFLGRVDIADAENIVPESLYLFLKLLCSEDSLAMELESDDDRNIHTRILSISQDIIFLVFGGKREHQNMSGLD